MMENVIPTKPFTAIKMSVKGHSCDALETLCGDQEKLPYRVIFVKWKVYLHCLG